MFEYMFSLVTDEFKVVGGGQEITQHSKEQNNVEKSVKGKFIRDLEALRDNGYALTSGNSIEISLQDILGLYDKKRPGVGAKIPYMTKRDPKVGSTPLSIGRVSLDKVLNKHLSPLFAETPMQVEFCLQVGIQ